MRSKVYRRTLRNGEIRKAAWNLSNLVSTLSTTVSSVAWESDNDSLVTVGGEALASNIATALITASATSTGCTKVKLTVTLANGEKPIFNIIVEVKGVDC